MLLVVDDQADARYVMQKLLSQHGFTVTTAGSGPEALEILKIAKPRIILLDVMMPGMTGIEMARELRADPANDHVRIIFFTAGGNPKDSEQAHSFGGDDLVKKPIPDIDMFIEKMRRFYIPPDAPPGANISN